MKNKSAAPMLIKAATDRFVGVDYVDNLCDPTQRGVNTIKELVAWLQNRLQDKTVQQLLDLSSLLPELLPDSASRVRRPELGILKAGTVEDFLCDLWMPQSLILAGKPMTHQIMLSWLVAHQVAVTILASDRLHKLAIARWQLLNGAGNCTGSRQPIPA